MIKCSPHLLAGTFFLLCSDYSIYCVVIFVITLPSQNHEIKIGLCYSDFSEIPEKRIKPGDSGSIDKSLIYD